MRKFNIDVVLEAKNDKDKREELYEKFNVKGESEIIEINDLNNFNGNANITLYATRTFIINNYDEHYSDFEIK